MKYFAAGEKNESFAEYTPLHFFILQVITKKVKGCFFAIFVQSTFDIEIKWHLKILRNKVVFHKHNEYCK